MGVKGKWPGAGVFLLHLLLCTSVAFLLSLIGLNIAFSREKGRTKLYCGLCRERDVISVSHLKTTNPLPPSRKDIHKKKYIFVSLIT